MAKGSRTRKMRQREGQNRKKARAKRRAEAVRKERRASAKK